MFSQAQGNFPKQLLGFAAMNNLRRLLIVLVGTLLIPIIPFVVIGELPGEQWLSASQDNDLAFALVGAGLLAVDVLLPVPSSIMITMLGARVGLLEGWLAAWLGLTVGNMVGYALGRLWPQRWAPKVNETPAVLALMLSRPVPVLAEALTITAGAARQPFLLVCAACLVGNGVYTLLLAANGALLIAASTATYGIVVMLAIPAIGWWLWRWLLGR